MVVGNYLKTAPGAKSHGLIGAAVFMMVKAAHEETYSLPLFGELAERSVSED